MRHAERTRSLQETISAAATVPKFENAKTICGVPKVRLLLLLGSSSNGVVEMYRSAGSKK